jgi:hypothetical protein
LAEHKEDRATLATWGNDLRQTYRTVGQAAGIADLDIHLLMNHAITGVNAGYITRNKLLNGHLRQQQETISRMIVEAAHQRRKHDKIAVASSLFRPARIIVDALMRHAEIATNQ